MRFKSLLATVCVVVATIAAAAEPDGRGNQPRIRIYYGDERVGDFGALRLPPDKWLEPSGDSNVIVLEPSPSAGSVTPVLTFSTCLELDGTVSLFLPMGSGCESLLEIEAQTPVRNGGVYGQLACYLGGGTTGTGSLAIQIRSGVCGSVGTTSTVLCSMGAGTDECVSGSETVTLADGACITARVIGAGGPFPAWVRLRCSMEKVG